MRPDFLPRNAPGSDMNLNAFLYVEGAEKYYILRFRCFEITGPAITCRGMRCHVIATGTEGLWQRQTVCDRDRRFVTGTDGLWPRQSLLNFSWYTRFTAGGWLSKIVSKKVTMACPYFIFCNLKSIRIFSCFGIYLAAKAWIRTVLSFFAVITHLSLHPLRYIVDIALVTRVYCYH